MILNKVRMSIWKKPALLYHPQIPLLSNLDFAMSLYYTMPIPSFCLQALDSHISPFLFFILLSINCKHLYTCTHWSPELFSQYIPQLTGLSIRLICPFLLSMRLFCMPHQITPKDSYLGTTFRKVPFSYCLN